MVCNAFRMLLLDDLPPIHLEILQNTHVSKPKAFYRIQSFINYFVTWKVIWRADKGRLNQHLYLPIGQLLMVVVLDERQLAAN